MIALFMLLTGTSLRHGRWPILPRLAASSCASLTEPQTVASLHAVQPLVEANRHITEIMIVADGGDQRRTLPLSSASWTTEGEELTFAPITGTVFDVILTDLDYPVSDTYPVGISPVGFAELTLGQSPPTEEWIRTPWASWWTVLARNSTLTISPSCSPVNEATSRACP